MAQRHVPGLVVMSYREIDPSVPFVTRGVVAPPRHAERNTRGVLYNAQMVQGGRMKIRKDSSPADMREALAKVKEELGPER